MVTVYSGTKRDHAQYQGFNRQISSTGCSGEGCVSRNPWPVHYVRYRGNICRLCTSCVLRNHPGAFCTKCFDLVDSSAERFSVVHCMNCPSVCHVGCLVESESASSFVCPTCASPNCHSYFALDLIPGVPSKDVEELDEDSLEGEDRRARKVFDVESAKILVAAASLASTSMQKAVAAARIEAERKAKDAVLAKKKAKEMLEKAQMIAKNEKNPKKLKIANSARIDVENRWSNVQDAIPISQIPPAKVITMGEQGKIPFSNNMESKELVPRVPSRNNDSPISNGNRRVVFTGLPENAGLQT